MTHDHRDQPVGEALARVAPTVDLLRTRTSDFLRGSDLDRAKGRLAHWNDVGMPSELGRRASDLLESFGLLDISLVSEQVDEPLTTIADMYHTVIHWVGVGTLLLRVTDLPRQSRWEALARAALRDDAYSAVVDIAISVMQTTRGAPPLLWNALWSGSADGRSSWGGSRTPSRRSPDPGRWTWPRSPWP